MKERIHIYTAGESRGNPGPAAVGVYITDAQDNLIQETAEAIGNATNDFAGFQAVLRGLQIVEELYGEAAKNREFEVHLSNELIQQYLNNEQQMNDASLVPHFIEVHNLRVSLVPHLILTYVEQEHNTHAYRLVQEALDATK